MNEPREITESFRLERVLKSSRSAIVFRAIDPKTGKVVAIKLIPPTAPGDLEASQSRFLAAMAAAALLPADGFPPMLDYGFTPDGSAFMVMEFVEGPRLDTLTDVAPERILRLLLDAVRSIEALAARGVGHGNIHPDNLLVVGAGAQEHLAILGFGTAAFQAEAEGGREFDGAVRFIAPERLAPGGAVEKPDWRSDVYSLAFTTCVLLGAEVAHTDEAIPTVTLPRRAWEALPDPVVLRAILEQALRSDPEARPSSLAEFREGLELALEGVPGHEALIPTVEEAAAIAAAEALPVATPVADDEPDWAALPLLEQSGPVPAALPADAPEGGQPPITEPGAPEALPPAVEVLTPVPASVSASELAAGPEPPQRPPKPRSRRGLVLALAAGVAVVIGAAAAFLFIQARRSSPPQRRAAVPTPAPRRPTAAPQPTVQPVAVTHLQNAEAAIALSDLVAARQALDAISQADLESLSADERERYATLRATYDAKVAQTLTRALSGALASGNLKALAETVRGISREDEAGFARNDDLLAALEEARRALNVQSLMLKAQRQGDWPGVLQQSSVLVSLVPRYTQAADLRERAAATLERDADELATKGNYEVALSRLETVRKSWPDRRGIAAHIERMKADHAVDQQLASLVAAAEQTEKERVPEKGLTMLAAASPPPRWQDRIRELRGRLTAQLQQLDAAPPTVALAPGIKLEYKKNEPATITLRIADDHGLKTTALHARVEGSGEFVELPLRSAAGGEYVAEISPAFHKNATVEFYVTASDFSDHVSQLGSPQEPLKLKRKKWSLFGR